MKTYGENIAQLPFGNFKTTNELVSFEGSPVLFHCIDDDGNDWFKYIVDLNNIAVRWLYIKITKSELYTYLAGSKPLKELFLGVKSDDVFLIDYNKKDVWQAIQKINSYTIPDDYLPDDNSRFISGLPDFYRHYLTEVKFPANENNTITKVSNVRMPTVFIGCSVEGLNVAGLIQARLQNKVTSTVWSQGVFGLSNGTLETLVKKSKEFDYAILILSPEDITPKRYEKTNAPRDNVMFELGLFMGAIGRENTLIVCGNNVTLPSDLAGATTAKYDVNAPDTGLRLVYAKFEKMNLH